MARIVPATARPGPSTVTPFTPALIVTRSSPILAEISFTNRPSAGPETSSMVSRCLLRQCAAAVFAQVLLLNQRLLGKEGPGHLGGSLFVWVQKSAWVNASTMRRWLSLLRKALQPRVGARTVLVFVDAAPPHLRASVWAHAKRCAVRLLLTMIPRSLTRLLQRQQMSRCLLFLKLC